MTRCSMCDEAAEYDAVFPLAPCEFCGDLLCAACSVHHETLHEDDCQECKRNYNECECGHEGDD